VDHGLFAQLFTAYDEPGRTEWPQPDHRSDDAIGRNFYSCESGSRRERSDRIPASRAAREEQGRTSQKSSP
jgi:hypothetical protein